MARVGGWKRVVAVEVGRGRGGSEAGQRREGRGGSRLVKVGRLDEDVDRLGAMRRFSGTGNGTWRDRGGG
jgi:hypothetical protein